MLSSKSLIVVVNLFDRFGAFLILPFLIGSLTKTEYSIWTQFIIIPPMIATLFSLGLSRGILNFFANKDRLPLEIGVVALIFIYSIAIILPFLFFSQLYDTSLTKIIFGEGIDNTFLYLMVISVLGETFYEIIIAYQRAKLQYNRIAANIFFRLVIKIFVVIWLIYLSNLSLSNSISYYVLLLFLLNIPFTFLIFNKTKIKLSGLKLYFNKLLKYSFPLLISGLVYPALLIFGRQRLLYDQGLESLADFSLAFSLLGIPVVIVTILNFIFFTQMATLFNSNKFDELAAFFSKYLCLNVFVFFLISNFLLFNNVFIYEIFNASDYILSPTTVLLFQLCFLFQFLYLSFYYFKILNKKTELVLAGNIFGFVVAGLFIFSQEVLYIQTLALGLTLFYFLSFLFIIYLLHQEGRLIAGGIDMITALSLIFLQFCLCLFLSFFDFEEITNFFFGCIVVLLILILDFFRQKSLLREFYRIMSL